MEISKRILIIFLCLFGSASIARAQDLTFGPGNIYMQSNARSRSISPENHTGEKGKGGMATTGSSQVAARELGLGWKMNPFETIKAGTIYTIADAEGPGIIRHIWMTPTGNWRSLVLRIYWDNEPEPSVEVPLGDFFCMGLGSYAPVNAQPIAVNPGSAFNCYWPMPFRKHCRMTVENLNKEDIMLFYQIDYALTKVSKDAAYFHAQFRRSNPTTGGIHVLLDSIQGKGQYVGTYMAIGVKNEGWWGEGEIKFYMDGDTKFPTINGTGLEDYFLGSYAFVDPHKPGRYAAYSTAYSGMPQITQPDTAFIAGQWFGLYRFHIPDPIYFKKDLKVTIQDLGWQSQHRFLIEHSDIATVSYWYQDEPHRPFPKFPTKALLEAK